MQDNLAHQLSKLTLISVVSPDPSAWTDWLLQCGFEIVDLDLAEVILWGDPEEDDWSKIVVDERIIVIGSEEVIQRCRQLQISCIDNIENGEEIITQLKSHAISVRETKVKQITSPPKSEQKKFHVPPKLEKIKKVEVSPEIIFEEENQKLTQDIIIAFPKKAGLRLQNIIHQNGTPQNCRVLDVIDDFKSLVNVLEQGDYEIILVHRELKDFINQFEQNIELIRSKAPKARIIVIERQTDYFTPTFKEQSAALDIEWHEISVLPGSLISILNKDDIDSESSLDWEPEAETQIVIPNRNAPQTQILRPALIASHSAGGGVGKSTTTLQLGFEYASLGYKTLVIDLDQEKPSIARGSGVKMDCPGLADWDIREDFKNEEAAIKALRRTTRQVRGLYVLPVGPVSQEKWILPFYYAQGDEPLRMANVLFSAALREFQIVLVDTNPNFTDPAVFQALKRADKVLYLMEGTKVFLDSAKIHLNEADQHGIELSNYHIIINKSTGKDPLRKKEISQTLEKPISAEIPLDVEGYRKAADKGLPYKPKKGESPWKGYAQKLLQQMQVPVPTQTTKKEKRTFNLFSLWRKK